MAILFEWYENVNDLNKPEDERLLHPRPVLAMPMETDDITSHIEHASSMSRGDIAGVLSELSRVVAGALGSGRRVHIEGLGYFRYVLDTIGVSTLEEFDFEKQVKAVRVEFIPEREKTASGLYLRKLVDSDELEWIELAPTTKDYDPATDTGDGGSSTTEPDDDEERPGGL